MKLSKLLDNALALLMTTRAQSPEYADYAVPLVNLLLAETRAADDLLRARAGKPPHSSLVPLTSLEDELPCEEQLAASVLPLGLCARLAMDDDDMSKVAYYQNQYVAAIGSLPALVAPVENVYAETAPAAVAHTETGSASAPEARSVGAAADFAALTNFAAPASFSAAANFAASANSAPAQTLSAPPAPAASDPDGVRAFSLRSNAPGGSALPQPAPASAPSAPNAAEAAPSASAGSGA